MWLKILDQVILNLMKVTQVYQKLLPTLSGNLPNGIDLFTITGFAILKSLAEIPSRPVAFLY
jgi:hypothetical protein